MNGRSFQLCTLLRNGIVAPETNNGTEVCLSYHSVNRPLLGAELTNFCCFIQDNVVTPDVGRT